VGPRIAMLVLLVSSGLTDWVRRVRLHLRTPLGLQPTILTLGFSWGKNGDLLIHMSRISAQLDAKLAGFLAHEI
jgi:hypothetical protein